ncbi:MAG: hypothetical protein ACI4RP_06725, partial [Acutalibacteraceae bacterium]
MENTGTKLNKKLTAFRELSTSEIVLYTALVLMPALVLVSLQAYVENGLYTMTSVLLGVGFGVIALMLCRFLIPSALKGNEILKTIALLSPSVLLFSFALNITQTTVFYCVSFIGIFILMYFGFIFPIKDKGRHICAALILLGMLFAIEYSLYVYDLFS